MQIIRIIILILSLIGYYLILKRKTKLKEEFIPIVLITSISLVIFIAFILNIAILSSIIIALAGLILFTKSVYEIVKNKEKLKFNFNIIFLIIFVLWAAIILKGTILIHYDNFSHWGMIAKEMLITNKLPNFESTTIMFTAYPPGTACIIYFFCKFIGNSEAKMLFAQSLVIISSLYTLFAFCNRNKKINYVITLIAIIYMLIGNIFITQLLVDTVLPVLGLAAFTIIIYYRNDTKKALIYSIPILSFLILVKNSGVFFVVIDLLVYFPIFIKKHGVKNILKNKYIFSTGFLGIKISKESFNLLAMYFISETFEKEKDNLSVGATMQSINNTTFKNMYIPKFENNDYIQFNKIAENIFKLIYKLDIEKNKLYKLKKTYLAKFF